jgi:hypothetical protein
VLGRIVVLGRILGRILVLGRALILRQCRMLGQ